MNAIEIVESSSDEIFPVRRSVLRPDRTPDESRYPTDPLEGTFHMAAFEGETLVGCASAHLEPDPLDKGATYRLRGMAVIAPYRSRGIGGRLLEAIEAGARQRGAAGIWCNGRLSAASFYVRHGWQPLGDEFAIIGIPHRVFIKPL